MSRLLLRTLLIAACVLSAMAPAFAGCRAGDAAAHGSQIGFERIKNDAVSLSQNQTQAQSLLQKCLAGIANMQPVSIFPSFSDIFDQIVQKVCMTATQQVNSAIGQINPANDVDRIMSDINDKFRQSTGGLISNPITSQPISTLNPQSSTPPPPPPDFWSNIWK